MPLLGAIIKKAIEAGAIIKPDQNHLDQQESQLRSLLEKARDTAFGKHHGFDALLGADDIRKAFREQVPYFDYNRMHEGWWKKQLDGSPDISWPGKPDYYALSSGTTGSSSKRIPVTDEMIKSIRNAGIRQVLSLRNFDLPSEFFEKEILMLGSSTDLQEQGEFREGEISGISAGNIPFWFRSYYKPGEEIARIDDWDDRVQRIADRASDWDIGALSGIPSWIELMLRKVIDTHGLRDIHEIWPNLRVYTSGGVAFGPYRKSFQSLMGREITVIDTYLASEGFLALQTRPETDAMQLLTDNGIYFEFVPFVPENLEEDGSIRQEAPSLGLDQVEADTDYALVISTVSGAWRYLIGDTVAFSDTGRAEIHITGRTKFFLNTVGSQLSVQKLDAGVQHLENTFDMAIPEYTLAAIRLDDGFHHCWYLGSRDSRDSKELASSLDNHLQEANKNYRVARSKALEGVKVQVVDPEIFYGWNESQKKKGGQVKMERVMDPDKFSQWEEFVRNQGTGQESAASS
ncbi:GH3 family domain-containing protein [Robiginitalea biformata]|uniref:Putative auxin-regulated protein n=1 Tax=Robiginitalea biformata (strain ATCC BAA-864 / DSM 15991 / KCTC 12146 / HTCC2501) TaxID=313596 RepID=A4CL76_ROBBH|nr:GH3 auxin-responsive promoter family protein [Robiginitalea biformata]EAR15625.1 putative auxin-regulated protein [Robiginitalea biformata HTCC2501]